MAKPKIKNSLRNNRSMLNPVIAYVTFLEANNPVYINWSLNRSWAVDKTSDKKKITNITLMKESMNPNVLIYFNL